MRLLLLEDDPILGAGLRDYLRAVGNVVDWCTRLAQARVAIREPYDALLLDWQLPDGSGLQWLSGLRAEGVATPALLLTAHDLLSDRIMGLNNGADDYLVKPFDLEELVARLRAVHRRSIGQLASRRRFGAVEVDGAAGTVYLEGNRVELTAREWALLESLVKRAGRVVSKQDLEQLITGFDGEVSRNTLEVHIFNLRRKLGRQIVQTIRGRGYRIDP